MRRYPFPGALYSDAQWEWVAAKRAEGYSMRKLSDFLGINTDAVLTALRVRGLVPQEKPTEPLDKADAEALGVARSQISVACNTSWRCAGMKWYKKGEMPGE